MTAARRRGDARPRVERTTAISAVIASVAEPRAVAALAYVLYGCPIRVIASELNMSVEEARETVYVTVSAIRHPSRSTGMREYAEDLGEMVTIDGGLRAFIRKHRLEERFKQRCLQCQDDLPPGRDMWEPGRPRHYCSNRCRQKAYRQRKSIDG
ncbi:hypothetical protein [Streptomyces erythrochromogenes]|uniref:hypothetical protein n=1 Tax=Streptomyces erythrochromogenes TaxID=285574 RepID=UPI0036CF3958